MILTCPECATRYFVEDSRLAGDGRTVRCASCKSSWHAVAGEPLELTNSETEGALARETLAFKPDEPTGVVAADVPKVFRAKIQAREKVKEAATAGAVWAGMVSVFAAILAGAYVFRVDVVKLYPKAAGAYALANVPVNPTGLEFERVKAEPSTAGLASIVVTGQVRNVEDAATTPPPMRVFLLDNGKRMASQVIRLPAKAIAPGKAVAFTASLPDPHAKADDVAVEFALDLVPKPKSKPRARSGAKPKPKPAAKAAPRPAAQVAGLRASGTGPAPARAAGLRPVQDLPAAAPVDARPLPADDPFALDTSASKRVSGLPHG